MLQHPIFWVEGTCVDTRRPFSVKPCEQATCNDAFPFIQWGIEIRGKGLVCDPGL